MSENYKSYRTLEKIKNYSIVVIDGVDEDGIPQVRNMQGFYDINQRLVMISHIPSQDNLFEYIEANRIVRGSEVVAILK